MRCSCDVTSVSVVGVGPVEQLIRRCSGEREP